MEDLTDFRRRCGLSGHAEREGKTSFLGFKTGPSSHGTPAAAGIALALKRAGAGEVEVILLEGEGGFTPGATHEIANSAWGLRLGILHLLLDWNDFGIDGHPSCDVSPGTPSTGAHRTDGGWLARQGGELGGDSQRPGIARE